MDRKLISLKGYLGFKMQLRDGESLELRVFKLPLENPMIIPIDSIEDYRIALQRYDPVQYLGFWAVKKKSEC